MAGNDDMVDRKIVAVIMSREFWIAFRQGLLMMLDAIERELRIKPRTAEMRKRIRVPQRELDGLRVIHPESGMETESQGTAEN